ncbi:hypothetical protein [Rubrivirga sp.]|uniref:hypothetical protein n=1 Tax=Rubrivirga sp. TaxID=1885344 RepID=UPI003B525D1E
MSRLAPWLAWVALLAVAGCEVPLDPIAPSDIAFSLSGYLDATADTQWVRVEPFERSTAASADPVDAAVTLSGLGGSVTLAQEVRPFVTGPAHLFWTTSPVAPGQTYQLVARAPDGRTASVTVPVPDTTGVEVDVVGNGRDCPVVVSVRGAERLADVQARYTFDARGRAQETIVSYVGKVTGRVDGSLQVSIYPSTDIGSASPGRGLQRAEVRVAITTPSWPATVGLTVEDVLFAQSPGLEGGVGFVGGVVTRRSELVPPGRCFAPGTRPEGA